MKAKCYSDFQGQRPTAKDAEIRRGLHELSRVPKPVRTGIPIVAADASPLIISAGEKFEPAQVGCSGIPHSAAATGRVPHGGADGNSFPEFILGWTMGGMNLVLTFVLTFYPLPQGRIIVAGRFWFGGRLSGKSRRANFQADDGRFSLSIARPSNGRGWLRAG